MKRPAAPGPAALGGGAGRAASPRPRWRSLALAGGAWRRGGTRRRGRRSPTGAPARDARRAPGRERRRHRPAAARRSASCATPSSSGRSPRRGVSAPGSRPASTPSPGRSPSRGSSTRSLRGDVVRRDLTVPEGTEPRRDRRPRGARRASSREAFLAAARDPAPVRDLDPAATDLEGYLFPDTYDLPRCREAPRRPRAAHDAALPRGHRARARARRGDGG